MNFLSLAVDISIFPNDEDAEFNRKVFESLLNILTDLVPDTGRFGEVIRVFGLPATTGGLCAYVVADPQSQLAICYLE